MEPSGAAVLLVKADYMFKQRDFTEKLLFDYYMVSSAREGEMASRFPFFLDRGVFEEMKGAALVLDGLVRRLITAGLAGESSVNLHVEQFPHLEKILGLNLPLPPFYWVRFDAFVRPGGGIFFTEFNYDKPCAQRELFFNNLIDALGNPNHNFREDFVRGLGELWAAYGKGTPNPTVGIMVDPNHYEELHLAYLYKDLLQESGYSCVIAGGKNFRVEGNRAFAFDRSVDIILRQYPAEHCDEIENIQALLDLYERGGVLLVNDPRAVLGQGKALFATLWELVEDGGFPLSEEEEKAIRFTIPRTWVYDSSFVEKLKAEKDAFVVKGNYSRYSEEVYIGRLHTVEQWDKVLDYLETGTKAYVVQEFCSSEPWMVRKYNGGGYRDTMAYGNFGVYLTNGVFNGLCVRWSEDLLTSDISWFSPVGIREQSLGLRHWWAEQEAGERRSLPTEHAPVNRKEIWREIYDRAAFTLDYTGGYTGNQEAFTLSCVELEQSLLEELYQASEGFLRVLNQTLDLVLERPQLLGPVLGISESLLELVTHRETSSMGLLGRLDWVVDQQGRLKLLEFNGETPAGLLESTGLNGLVAEVARERGRRLGEDPNQGLAELIRAEFTRIINDFSQQREIKTIGFVSSTYYEDWYHTRCLLDMVKDLPYDFVLGEVSGLRAEVDRLWLHNTPLDAVYRYYPLDWLEDFPGVLAALGRGTMSINPVHTYILQSKALLALIWELAEKGYYGVWEQELIRQYLPKTALKPQGLEDFVVKPYFSREGQGVVFSEELRPGQLRELSGEDVIFQERVYLQQLGIELHNGQGECRVPAFPVLGIYTVGDKATGIYTRAGAGITGKEAVYLPTFVRR
ncbi:MAG: glutathionylspermidine synthase family protein [Thermincolia bacterium]